MALTLHRVEYTYASGTAMAQPALDDVSIEVAPGELVLVLGTTGSGKSTLLRIAAGLLAPQGGDVTLDGVAMTPLQARGRIGLVFQNPETQLFAETLADDVMFGPKNLGAPAREAREMALRSLVRVGLDPAQFAERSPFTLSGGEARRAAFAGVLAMEPRYLLADEPTAGLDGQGRRAIRSLLTEVREEAGVVVVTHTAEEFLGDADRVVILAAGRCAWSGQAAQLVQEPAPLLDAGLVPPAVLEVQRVARAGGLSLDSLSLDTDVAAGRLAAAAGWS